MLPRTAHPSFHKACVYFGVKPAITDFDPVTFRADVNSMRNAITGQNEGFDIDALADNDLNVTSGNGNGGTSTMYRLREGIERFLITDINNPGASSRAQSAIFIMWDITSRTASDFNHVPGGSNVLYLDGHVDFIRYPGPEDSPLNRGFAQFASEIAL